MKTTNSNLQQVDWVPGTSFSFTFHFTKMSSFPKILSVTIFSSSITKYVGTHKTIFRCKSMDVMFV